ncbi:MAG: hypothetical protein M3Z64_09485 [Verrucomicrobiota bacterium]|nr:hypothetical protein [Verrucomicrobiota bacterium]
MNETVRGAAEGAGAVAFGAGAWDVDGADGIGAGSIDRCPFKVCGATVRVAFGITVLLIRSLLGFSSGGGGAGGALVTLGALSALDF